MALSRKLLGSPRLEMDLSAVGLANVPILGRYRYSYARQVLREHSHGNALEVCYLVRGRQTYRVHGRDYHLRGGDVFITFPHERHGSGDSPEERGLLYWLVRRAPARPVPGRRSAGDALWDALRRLPRRQFAGSRKMQTYLDAATAAFHENGPLRALTLEHLVTGFLIEVVRCGSAVSPVERRSLDTVLQYMAAHLDEPLSIPQLAQFALLSVSHFKARFKDELGVPPAEFQMRARVAEARRLLAAGRHTVTEVAFDLGFSSSQYFATVFKRFTGVNPGACLPRTNPSPGF